MSLKIIYNNYFVEVICIIAIIIVLLSCMYYEPTKQKDNWNGIHSNNTENVHIYVGKADFCDINSGCKE